MDYRDIDLSGSTGPIYFRHWDTFHGIPLAELLKRLRLDPEGSPVDLETGVAVYLDDAEVPLPDSSTIEDIDDLLGEAPQDGFLAAADNGHLVSADARLKGGWLIDLFYEVRHEAVWVGEVTDLRALALGWIRNRANKWGIDYLEEFNADSPCLDPHIPADREALQGVADLGIRVKLNSVLIAPTSSGGGG